MVNKGLHKGLKKQACLIQELKEKLSKEKNIKTNQILNKDCIMSYKIKHSMPKILKYKNYSFQIRDIIRKVTGERINFIQTAVSSEVSIFESQRFLNSQQSIFLPEDLSFIKMNKTNENQLYKNLLNFSNNVRKYQLDYFRDEDIGWSGPYSSQLEKRFYLFRRTRKSCKLDGWCIS